VPLKSASSYEALKAGAATATNQNGLLLAISNGDTGPFIVAMEDDAAQVLAGEQRMDVVELGRDPSWRPTASAGYRTSRSVRVGGGVEGAPPDPDGDAREGVSGNVVIEAYDTRGKTYYTTTAIDLSHSLSQTACRSSTIIISASCSPTARSDRTDPVHRSPHGRSDHVPFVDEAIDIGSTNRMVNAIGVR
jgi:hypothetical protein